jgi:hypothetical protein
MVWNGWVRAALSVAAMLLVIGPTLSAQTPLRDQAVVRLTFDEPSGPALDTATVGNGPDHGQLANDIPRVTSPFWSQTAGKALQLDQGRQHAVEIPDSPDVDRPDGVSFSLLAINLLPANDGGYHALVAKRGANSTNYGINFVVQGDNYQVYIHDGAGYRVAHYKTSEALPLRKLVHVTATYQIADAPGHDADADVDDMRVQYFVNGQPSTPTAATGGFVQGTEAWFVDIKPAGLLNDYPLTIGRSEPGIEFLSAVVDEFLLFPRALSPEEARQLFLEVGGPNVEELIKLDQPGVAAIPDVVRLSQPGITIGTATQLAIVGKNLARNPKVLVAAEGVSANVVGETNDDRVNVKFDVALTALAGIYPLYVQTDEGLSEPQPLAIDILPHTPATQVTAEAPASLPIAIHGFLAGGQEPRAYFQGVKGQRIVADLELTRLGGKAKPVLELKTAGGAPLTIAWGQTSLSGDVRLEHRLPADGLYYVELHDLVYRAPGPNPYRLKLGDLTLVDLPLPLAGGPGPLTFVPIGTGFPADASWTSEVVAPFVGENAPLALPSVAHVVGPWPWFRVSTGPEYVEAAATPDQPPVLEALFADPQQVTVGVSGRLAKAGERDHYKVRVTPGQSLRFRLQAIEYGSPVVGELEVMNAAGQRVAISGDQPSETDPIIDFAVPGDQSELLIGVRDLLGHGGPRNVYRLVISPVARPDFSLTTTASVLQLPEDGSGVMELTVARAGYNGPIAMSVPNDPTITLSPAQIPAGVVGKVYCRWQRTAGGPVGSPWVKLVGTSVDVQPPVVRLVSRTPGSALTPHADLIAVGRTDATGFAMDLEAPPAVLYKGAPVTLKTKLVRPAERDVARRHVRMTLRSTEPVRPKQAGNPAAGTFPVVQVPAGTLIAPGIEQTEVRLDVPFDIAEPAIEFVLVAEAVPHAYSERVVATAYSQPFRMTVQAAATPQVDGATLAVAAEAPHVIVGKLQRTAGFVAPVQVTLLGLPAGYQVTTAEVAGDQDEFRITVTAPAVAAETAVPNVKLRVTTAGSPIAADQDVAVKVVPKG